MAQGCSTAKHGDVLRPHPLLRLTLMWLAVYLLCQFYDDALFAALWILAGAVWLLVLGVGMTLLLFSIVHMAQRRQVGRQRIRAGIAATLIVVFCGLHFHFGTTWARDLRFHFERPGYEVQLHQVLSAPPSKQAITEVYAQTTLVDRSGGVVRVAFVQPGGMLDNWTGIVYDPSGAVEKINGAKDWNDWQSPRFGKVRKLFGGDLTSAHPLGGGWYRCSFT